VRERQVLRMKATVSSRLTPMLFRG